MGASTYSAQRNNVQVDGYRLSTFLRMVVACHLAYVSLFLSEVRVNKYLKAIVAVMGSVGIALQTQYPGNHWADAVIAIFSTALVYLVPNEQAIPKVTEVPKS